MKPKGTRLSLGRRLRSCPSYQCLGVKPNWEDYDPAAQSALCSAERVAYPSRLYEGLFLALGKEVFPRNYYAFMGNKMRQTALFQLLDIPHPRTRLYYGKERAARILGDFQCPFVAKTPLGSSMGEGVWLIRTPEELARYLAGHQPAYIQEYFPLERDLRVVLIAQQVVHAYWRVAPPGEFRNNVSQGGRVDFGNIPTTALQFAVEVASLCRFDEVGLDICEHQGRWYVLEANMVYGLEGFRRAGLDIHELLTQLDSKGLL
jgi:ribosomal protein S6--L-glutamate ligase